MASNETQKEKNTKAAFQYVMRCKEMCKNYLSVTSNIARSRSGGGARGGGENLAVRSGGGGTALLLLLHVISLFVVLQISFPLVNGTAEDADLLVAAVLEAIMGVHFGLRCEPLKATVAAMFNAAAAGVFHPFHLFGSVVRGHRSRAERSGTNDEGECE